DPTTPSARWSLRDNLLMRAATPPWPRRGKRLPLQLPLTYSLAVQEHVQRVLHRTRGDNLSGVDEEDLVGVGDCVQAMGNDHLRRGFRQLVKDLLKLLFRDGVDVRRRFIEDQNLRIPQHRAHERDKLLLPEADGIARCRDLGLKSLLKA